MGRWTVILQDERGKQIQILDGNFVCPYIPDQRYKLLKYIDRYGDTIFNTVQMPDLIDDFNALKAMDNNSIIDEIISLANRCHGEVHTYLAFYGD